MGLKLNFKVEFDIKEHAEGEPPKNSKYENYKRISLK